jgi:hypothetical protein
VNSRRNQGFAPGTQVHVAISSELLAPPASEIRGDPDSARTSIPTSPFRRSWVMIPGDEPEDIVHPCGKDLT